MQKDICYLLVNWILFISVSINYFTYTMCTRRRDRIRRRTFAWINFSLALRSQTATSVLVLSWRFFYWFMAYFWNWAFIWLGLLDWLEDFPFDSRSHRCWTLWNIWTTFFLFVTAIWLFGKFRCLKYFLRWHKIVFTLLRFFNRFLDWLFGVS